MRFAIVSDKGGRADNADAVGRLQKNGTYCFVLSGGINDESGDASTLAATTIIQSFDAQTEITEDMLQSYFEAANNAVINEHGGMETAAVTLVTDGNNAVWGHCGNSRLYRFKKHLIQEVTDDHTAAFESFIDGDIEYEDIRVSPKKDEIMSAVGDVGNFMPQIYPVMKMEKGTSFLLCSDGFWEHVDEDYMEHARKHSDTPKEWLQYMLDERKRNAPEDADNFSAIAVFI